MNKCLNCGGETNNKKFCSISCQSKFQNPGRSDKKFGVFKSFTVKCHRCGKNFEVIERENLFPKKKIYYCGMGCANSRIHSQKTKDKIKEGVIKNLKITNREKRKITLICKQCGKKFEVVYNRRKQLFCCRSCVTKWRNINTDFAKNAGLKSANNKKHIKFLIKSCDKEILNKKTFIYSLEYPIGNVRYIGKSDNPNERLKKHIKEAKYRKGKNHRDKWMNSLSEPPILNIIEETTYEHWQDREMFWIKYYKEQGCKLVNGTDGGEGGNSFSGRKHTQETKDKLSKIAQGRVITQEMIDKISGENNCRCKLKNNEVWEILHLYYKQEMSCEIISKEYNISKKYIYQLVTGRKRKDIFNKYNSSIT